MTRRIQTRIALRGSAVVWVVWVLMGSFAAAQDGVKLSGLWVEPVTVHGIEGGEVRYQIASGRVLTRPAANLEGLKLGQYPGLAKAEQAIQRGDDAGAVEPLREVMERARLDWVRWFAGKRLMAIHTRLDDADAAAGIYVDMVVSGAGLNFIAEPPAEVVARADVAVRARVSALAGAAKGTVGPDRGALLDQLVQAAGQATEIPPTDLDAGQAFAPGSVGGVIQGLALSTSVPPGTAASLFRQGQYERALRVADESLAQPGKTAPELYLKGMAQLGLAEQSGDESVYKSAGLNFMRVLVYFPRSAVAGPATLEAGYVHEKIGRTDIAMRLYDRAGPLIDQREDPDYFQRLMQRVRSVAEAGSGE